MFSRILTSALFAGAAAGLIAALLQLYFVQPVLLHRIPPFTLESPFCRLLFHRAFLDGWTELSDVHAFFVVVGFGGFGRDSCWGLVVFDLFSHSLSFTA